MQPPVHSMLQSMLFFQGLCLPPLEVTRYIRVIKNDTHMCAVLVLQFSSQRVEVVVACYGQMLDRKQALWTTLRCLSPLEQVYAQTHHNAHSYSAAWELAQR